jgi:hypothetical protein
MLEKQKRENIEKKKALLNNRCVEIGEKYYFLSFMEF